MCFPWVPFLIKQLGFHISGAKNSQALALITEFSFPEDLCALEVGRVLFPRKQMLCTRRASDGSCRKMPSPGSRERGGLGGGLTSLTAPAFPFPCSWECSSPGAVGIAWKGWWPHPNPNPNPWGHFVLHRLLGDVGLQGHRLQLE